MGKLQGTPRHCDRRHVDPEVKHLTSAVRFDAVSKNFGSRVAVRELSLTIPEGIIYGFLGPNGAGKTTAMRLMLGIHLPDAGSLSVLGHADPRRVRGAAVPRRYPGHGQPSVGAGRAGLAAEGLRTPTAPGRVADSPPAPAGPPARSSMGRRQRPDSPCPTRGARRGRPAGRGAGRGSGP